jgi:hypothetical protein
MQLPQLQPFPYHPPATDVQIVPGLPDPNNRRVYRLQVGAFYNESSATWAYQQLLAAGFDPVYEYSHNAYRVLAVGIPSQSVAHAAQRLGSLGFKQIWVRE